MKYKVGDKVRIKSIDWYNENKDEDGEFSCGEFDFVDGMKKFCSEVFTISEDVGDGYLMLEDNHGYVWTDEMIEGLVEEENNDCEKCGLTRNSIKCLFMDNCPHNKQKHIIEVPEDYVLKDENGNVINAMKIILEKKKKEYPKTFVEVLDFWYPDRQLEDDYQRSYKKDLIKKFQDLLYARDAYWKIAGDEMGLGKPWEPDWREKRYIIYRNQDDIIRGYRAAGCVEHHIFEFPTAEMRDVFYDNFKELIEQCRELL